MNILILHGSSDLYGASNVLLNVIRVLKDNQDQPIVVLSERGPLVDRLESLGVEVRLIRLGILRRKYFTPGGLLNRLSVLKNANKQLKALIKEKNIDIVYSHTTAVLIGAIVARQLKLRHIWHVLEITTKPLFFVRTMAWFLNNFSETVITASDAVKNHWKQWVEAKKLKTIYNGLDCRPFENKTNNLKAELGLSEDTVLIGMLGRVHFWKGQDYFIHIAAELIKLNPHVHFIMAGDAYPGYEYLYIENQAIIDSTGIHQNMHNLGYREDIVNIMNSLDIFVSPSVEPDPFPTVVLEAMAAAKPVVATNHGGATEMVAENLSGLLIPIRAPKEAAQMMLPLVLEQTLRTKMGTAGAKRIREQFSADSFKTAILKTFAKPAIS